MNRWLVGLVLLMGMVSAPVVAQESNVYYGLGISDGTIKVPGNGSRSLGTIGVSIGNQLTDRVGLELAFGAGTDQPSSLLSESLVQYQAGLLRLSHAWSNKQVYVVLGHARLDVDSRLNPIKGGNVMGFGINLFGSKNTAINVNVLNIGDSAFTSATLGIQYFIGGVR